ncbi:DUF1829 domain-containing protein [Veillonella caviae]|uniref:DUF1829 domain-containing protein n=1 Tax=Veillonella caviae TaxID=248316 RepID=UPI002357E0C1|nr:DUF1829 domain-containing protein [Veillonella caviae]
MKYSSKYLDWLKSEFTERDLGNGYTEITAPFLDRHNDYIQVYIQTISDNLFRLSDDMYTINDLKMSGVDLTTPKRKQVIQDVIRKRGIELDIKTGELFLNTSSHKLGEAQHQMFQAMLDINDLFYLNQASIKTFFFEDVVQYFDDHKIYYTRDISFKGKSGYTQNFDFVLQRNERNPERLIKLLNVPNRANLERLMFSWEDVQEQRNNDGKFIIMINDRNKNISGHLSHLEEYNIQGIPWSQIDNYQTMLA